jgi:hypothetical protein
MRFQVHMTASMKMRAFWVVVVSEYTDVSEMRAALITLMIEVVRTSETSVCSGTTLRRISDGSHLQNIFHSVTTKDLMHNQGPLLGGKARQRRDADHSPQLVPRSWMSRSCTSSPPSAFMACTETTLRQEMNHRPEAWCAGCECFQSVYGLQSATIRKRNRRPPSTYYQPRNSLEVNSFTLQPFLWESPEYFFILKWGGSAKYQSVDFCLH